MDIFNSVMDSWRRKSLGFLPFINKLTTNFLNEGSVENLSIGNPTEFKRGDLKVTVDENGDLIGTVDSTFMHCRV